MSHWSSWAAFFSMGGRGAFVWGAYGLAALLIALEVFSLRRSLARSIRHLCRLQRLGD
ncbi:MAG: heme exporter protein CcmD [Rhodocyclaceae bacterium]